MLEIDSSAPPVFVDVSGRRRRKLRRIAYAIGAALLLALAVLWVSQLIGTVRPDPVAPCTPAASAGAAARPTGEACRR